MKKRVYKAVNVKNINVAKLKKEVDGKEIILGVDVAKEDYVAAITTKEHQVMVTISWKHPSESQIFLTCAVSVISCSTPHDIWLHRL